MDIQTLEDERRRAIQAQGDLRMGVSGGWNIAREPNMEDSPYRPYKPDYDPDDDIGDWGYGWEKDGQGFFTPLPKVQNPETNDMMIANFLAPSGTGKTLSDEWYEKGLETILETTEPGSWQQKERLNILEHQYLDQVNNPAMKIASHDNKPFKSVPATGPRGDTMAPDWLIDYMNRKDENLFQTIDRLRRA